MIDLTEMKFVVNRLTYKPGWTIEVYETAHQGVWVAINAHVENSYKPGEFLDLRIKSQVPPMRKARDFAEWVLWRLEVIEVHECHEWLKFDDQPLYDPHAEGADEPA